MVRHPSKSYLILKCIWELLLKYYEFDVILLDDEEADEDLWDVSVQWRENTEDPEGVDQGEEGVACDVGESHQNTEGVWNNGSCL